MSSTRRSTRSNNHSATNHSVRNRSPTGSLGQLHDQAISALVPFFIEGPTGDVATARVIAEGLLDDYKATTPKELQLSAQIIALGWASLVCVSASMVVKDQSLEEMLRLQGYALKLDRLSRKATKGLEEEHKQRAKNPGAMPPGSTLWDEGAFQLAINQAAQKMHEANDKLTAFRAPSKRAVPPAPKLSPLFGEQMTPAVLSRRRRG